jgi:hypothetical protein
MWPATRCSSIIRKRIAIVEPGTGVVHDAEIFVGVLGAPATPMHNRELQVNIRVGRQEAYPDRRDDCRRRCMNRIDPQPPHGSLALLIQILERTGDLIDCRSQPIEQTPAGVGERHAARRAMQ